MKKTGLIILTLAALVATVVWADRATRAKSSASGSRAGVPAEARESAPEVSFKDLEGKEHSLAEYKGRVVLVNFWATWCGPCRVEIPWLIEMQQKYGPRGFTVLGVAMDDEGRKVVEPFVARERFDVNGAPAAMNYPIVIGDDGVAQKFGGLIGFPTSILIARDGRIVKRITGLASSEEVARAIEGLL